MEPVFKDACKAVQPYFNIIADKFIQDLKDGVFIGDEEDFIKAKHKIELLSQMKQTIINEGDK